MRAARRPHARPGLIAIVIALWVVIAAIALIGTLAIALAREHPASFASPVKIYPVTQEIPGQQCPPGIPGAVGTGPYGPICYRLTTGITIKQVDDIHVERAGSGGGYEVSLSLIPADGRALGRLTRGSVGRPFALTVRDQVVAAPRVDKPITEGRILISGNFSRQAADTIMNRLKGRRAGEST